MITRPSVLAGGWDAALAAEHKAALALFDKLEATEDHDVAKRTILLTQLKHAIGKHALQEENAIYAMMRDCGLEEAADRVRQRLPGV